MTQGLCLVRKKQKDVLRMLLSMFFPKYPVVGYL